MWIFAIILWELYNRKKPFCEYDFCPMKLGKLVIQQIKMKKKSI